MVLLAVGFGWAWFKSERLDTRRMYSERQLTHNTPENRILGNEISPDGKYLAYADTKGLHFRVIDTGEVHDIPIAEELQTQIGGVRWFPDGQKLLFTAPSKTGDSGIMVTSIFGGTPRKLRTGRGDWSAVASPQGSSIAFINGLDDEIWVMGANGENPRKVLTTKAGHFAALAWSPMGQRLVYIKSGTMGGWTGGSTGGSIETVALEGGAPCLVISDTALVSFAGIGTPLWWVQNGRLIFALWEPSGARPTTSGRSGLTRGPERPPGSGRK